VVPGENVVGGSWRICVLKSCSACNKSANPGNTFDPRQDLTHPAPPLPQIDFDNRKKFDVLNDCLMTVDRDRLPGNAFASHKYGGKSALRYELGVSILGGTWCGSRAPTLLVSLPISAFFARFSPTSSTPARGSRWMRDMRDTPTKLSVPRTPRIRRRTRQCRGEFAHVRRC
jgi:hypothetical protein